MSRQSGIDELRRREITDLRETSRLPCGFAHLAAPMRKAGPRRFGYRP